MNITRETLLKIARDTAAERMRARPSLISAYLIGSVAAGEPLLGEATDIDLILIDEAAPPAREVARLSDQVALDIEYRSKADYANAKALRVHPWRGPEMAEPIFLNDPQHFFELAQASARGQFHRPDHVAARARTFVEWARRELHVSALPGADLAAPVSFASLCRALLNAANAAISLTGFPGAGRRLVMKLETAARALGRADVYDEFVAVFGGALDVPSALALLTDWTAAYQAGQAAADELIHPARRTLYERGFRAQIEAERTGDALWLMLYTWQACLKNVSRAGDHADRWTAFLERLGMAAPEDFNAKIEQARAYVTLASETVEEWADKNGG